MTHPSLPLGTASELLEVAASDRNVLDSLRFRIQRLIDEELSVIPRTGGRRRGSGVLPELFDPVTGVCIFSVLEV